jgi:plastocyanin
MPLLTRKDREAVGAGSAAFAFVALMIAVFALITVAGDDADGVAANPGGTTITLNEFSLTPASVSIPEGGKLTVVNGGTVAHNLSVDGTDLKTKDLAGGETDVLDLSSLEAGSYTMFCAATPTRTTS